MTYMTFLINSSNRNSRDFTDGFYNLAQPTLFPSLLSSFFDNSVLDYSARYNLEEMEDGNYSLTLPLAGFKKNEVDVSLEKNVLTVTAKNAKSSYSQSVTLWEDIDTEKIDAKLEDGLLDITLVKKILAKPKKVAIK